MSNKTDYRENRKHPKTTSVTIVSSPINKAGVIPLSNLIQTLIGLNKEISVISGKDALECLGNEEKVRYLPLTTTSDGIFKGAIFEFFLTQLRMSLLMKSVSKDTDYWIFFIGGELLIMPSIMAKLSAKPIFLVLPGSAAMSFVGRNDLVINIVSNISEISKKLATKIVIYSQNMINECNLMEFKDKTVIAREHFVDNQEFTEIIQFDSRPNVIGFVGRFSPEKGVLNLLEAIRLHGSDDKHYLFIGDGPQLIELKKRIAEYHLGDKITLTGWVKHENLVHYLNKMKILIIPSYSEGLPNVMVESMSCGTPVLANSVGSIPDHIRDGDNGFLMENNDPLTICTNLDRVLTRNDLELCFN